MTSLPDTLRRQIEVATIKTANNKTMYLQICISYSGSQDVVQAVRHIAKEAKEGRLRPEDINENHISERLRTNILSNGDGLANNGHPDMFIRTSGVLRLSDFMLWELQYAELYFSDKLWPDFDKNDLETALEEFSMRKRRYGK